MSEFAITEIPTDLHYRAVRAAEAFLERRGFEDLARTGDEEWPLVGYDDGTLVLAAVFEKVGDLPRERIDRTRAEKAAMRLICADPGISEAMIRFDAVSVAVLHGDRAFIRHHLGCLSDR